MKLAASYFLAASLALLIIAPPFDYSIPLMINSFHWSYLVIVSGLLGLLLCRQSISVFLKFLAVYLFVGCFLSQAPYLSFNAYILVVFSLWLYQAFRHCDYKPVFDLIEAAFWLEVILVLFQLGGYDRLLNFDRPEKVFLGTVMQYMRFASVLTILSPFLLLRSRWYLLPLIVLCALSRSSGFAISLLSGVTAYVLLRYPQCRKAAIAIAIGLVGVYALYDWGSVQGAIDPKCGGRLSSWWAIWITWFTDTTGSTVAPFLYGPFQINWFLFGHGLDTFLALFPIYKHDMNPFPRAHNDWLQLPWEIGLVGAGAFIAYCVTLVKRCCSKVWPRPDFLAGLVIIGVNMFFAFPSRMTQTMFLMIAYAAYIIQVTAPERVYRAGLNTTSKP